jgi:hypothetical protein
METLETETPVYKDTSVPIHSHMPDMSSGSPCTIANPITYEDKSSPVIPRTPTLLRRSEVLTITYEDTPETHETPLHPERKTIVGVVTKRRPDTPAARPCPRTSTLSSALLSDSAVLAKPNYAHTQNILSYDGKPSPDNPRTPTLLRRSGVLAEYAHVVCDIRNMRTLRTSHRIAIQQFSRAQLLEIIDIYDLIIQNVDYMFS